MPIIIKVKAEYGDPVYLKNDEVQTAYTLIGVKGGPGHICYQLSSGSEVFECYDLECSFERDEAKRLSFGAEE